MPSRQLTIERYEQVKKWTSDYGEALVRTNLAVRCWLRRVGERPDRFQRGDPPAHLVLSWLVRNHIVQAFYRAYGIDVLPDPEDAGPGHGMVVQVAEGCKGKEPARLATIEVAGARVEPHLPGMRRLDVYPLVEQGEDPLWVIDTAAILAVGGRWPRHCYRRSCPHRRDAAVYLALNQVITLLLCMGYARDAMLVRPSGYSQQPTFVIRLADGETIRIQRSTGELLTTDGTVVPFADWCGDDVDQGVRTLGR